MYRTAGKIFFDVLVSSLGIVVLLPLCIVISLLVKLSSRGPVFFVQRRMGLSGKPFYLLKFRTMFSDNSREKLLFEPGIFNRITPLGKILRKFKLDEMPQLINVLKGDMSLVGPRPEVEKYREFYAGEYEQILGVRPGITDLASLKYRNEEELLRKSADPEGLYYREILPEKLKMNLSYVRDGISLRGDILVVIKTVFQMFS
jgi:lipopolysaccharide/colanic/teichoic acid biosynthesis glycosyltransferase